MEITLKHRLIGATVILALVVIFVPMFFSKHAKKQMLAMQDIPQAPAQTLMEQPATQTTPNVVTPQVSNEEVGATPTATPSQEAIEKAQNQVVTQPDKAEAVDQAPMNETVIEAPASVEPVISTPEPKPVKDVVQPTTDHPLMHSMHKHKVHHHFAKHFRHVKTKTHHQRIMKAKAHHQAYVVQLGSFADPKHAKTLISQLRKKGFTAFGYKSKVNNQIYTRVYIGPAVQLSKAQLVRNSLAQVMHMQGIVKQFQATRLE